MLGDFEVSFGGDMEGTTVALLIAIVGHHAVQQIELHVPMYTVLYTSTLRSNYKCRINSDQRLAP